MGVKAAEKKGYFQTKAACYFAIEMYAPGKYNAPEVSPIFTEDMKDMPAVIINAKFDPLRDDGVLYAAKFEKVWLKSLGQMLCRSNTLFNRFTTGCWRVKRV